MTYRQMLHRRSQAFRRAGLLVEAYEINRINARREERGQALLDLKPKWPPKNALRHSFLTYHVALPVSGRSPKGEDGTATTARRL